MVFRIIGLITAASHYVKSPLFAVKKLSFTVIRNDVINLLNGHSVNGA